MLKFLVFVLVFIYLSFLALILIGLHYRNGFTLNMFIGKKGAGKTTLITKLTFKYLKRGWKVYSNVEVPGAFIYDPAKIGQLDFDQNSIVFCDEIGMIFDNREFAKFDNAKRDWFKLQRHYKVKFYAFSQAWDIDKKIRALTDNIYLIDSYFNCISVARKVRRKLTIVHPDGASESRIADDLEFTPWWQAPFGGLMITWLPSWMMFFNSFDAPNLELKEFEYYPLPDNFDVNHKFTVLQANILRKWDDLLKYIDYKVFEFGVRFGICQDIHINNYRSSVFIHDDKTDLDQLL